MIAMSFLQPLLLWGLPLIALPVIIHLIHLHRRRTVKWAAMMFLLAAQRMNKGFSRLRQLLILAFRVLALLALIFVISRPLSGGWLGLTGGAPDTVMILVDRSASMEQQNVLTNVSKRTTGLRNLAKAIKDTVGTRSRLVLLDSADLKPLSLERADALVDLPQTEATDTTADVPAMLQGALDYITRNKTGRTDVWLLSDMQAGDWDANGGRWEALRGAFMSLQGVRFRLLCYPQPAKDNLGVTVERVVRRETADKAELLLDIRVVRQGDPSPQPVEVPLRVVVNGVSSVLKVELKENQLLVQAQAVPIDKSTKRGWGRIQVPADSYAADNTSHFVFDEPAVLRSVIVSDDETVAEPLKAALSAAADSTRKYAATVLAVSHAAEIPWDDVALIVWQAPLPKPDNIAATQLQNHVAAGRSVVFLPSEISDDAQLFGLRWGGWQRGGDKPKNVEWWRNDAGLLANTRDGASLPVGELEVLRYREITGEGVPLARVGANQSLLMRSTVERGGGAYFLGTLPGSSASSLARDGVVMFAMVHRALNDGARGLGKAQMRYCALGVLGEDSAKWRPVTSAKDAVVPSATALNLRAGVMESGEKLVALNRPPSEDSPQVLTSTTLDGLFKGIDYERVEDTLESNRSLTSEVWRTFLIAMAIFIVGESLLCMPQKREAAPVENSSAFASVTSA